MKKALILFVVISFILTCSTAFSQVKPKIDSVKKDAKAKVQVKKASFPAVDLIKSAESYVLIAELPGVSSKNITLEYIEGEKNYVELAGTKGDVALKTKGKKVQAERFIGKFNRKVNIADDIIKSKISAEFKDNILVVTLPIRKFQVKTSIKIK